MTQVAQAVDKLINALGAELTEISVEELGNAGAKRVSVGGAFARLIACALIQAAQGIHENGDLSWNKAVASSRHVAALFARAVAPS